MKKNKNNNSYLQIIILILIILVLLIFYFLTTQFSSLTFEQILFHLKVPQKNASNSYLEKGIDFCLMKFIIISTFLLIINYLLNNLNIDIIIRKKLKKFNLNEFYFKSIKVIIIIFAFISYKYVDNHFFITKYIKNQFNNSKLYENYYIEPKDVDIDFPDKKNNLIYIYVESLETTDVSIKNGGARQESLIPNLEKLSSKNLNFSNNDKLGGFHLATNTGWTIAALIAHTSGIPLKIYGSNSGNKYDKYEYFLKNSTSIGEILYKNGYKNYFLMGSDKQYAGRDTYFEKHGDYKIYDFNSAKAEGKIPKDYDINWWGFEDKKLYEYAKEQLLKISNKDEPFNFTMLTVDTHPYGGYLDETCEVDEDLTSYQNVVKCADNMLNEFIKWLKKQKFYNKTTIIIVGDHLNQVTEDIYEDIDKNYVRTNFNLFINSKKETDCNKNRTFTAMDLYPTTLAALGVNIKGERLGLGTNLFSCKETLAEELGLKELNEELELNSKYYSKCLFHGEC